MQVPKPSPADVERFRAVVPEDPRVTVKPMFGNLGAFVNGNMFLGLLGPDIGVKLRQEDEEKLRALGGGPFGTAERAMGGWLTLPAAMVGTSEGATWVGRAFDHISALPPKAINASKPSKSSRSATPRDRPTR